MDGTLRRPPPPPTANPAMGAAEWVLLGALSVLWGGSFFFVEVAVAEVPPLTLVLARVGLAAAALTLAVRLAGQRLPGDLRGWRDLAVMATLNNLIPFTLIVWGQSHIASGLAAVLNATTPLFSVCLAPLLGREERFTAGRVGGVTVGVAGVAVLVGSDALGGLGVGVTAQIAVLGAALAYALAGIFGRRFAGRPPLVTAAGQLIAATALTAPLALVIDRPWTLPAPSLMTGLAIVALALVSTALAYVIYFRVLATAGATNILLVTLLVPVTASLLGVGILGERLAPSDGLGMALIALGLIAIDGRAWRALTGSRAAVKGEAKLAEAGGAEDVGADEEDGEPGRDQ